MHRIEGIFPAIITPFNSDGDIEFNYLRDVVRYQLENGVHGFFVCGSMGEGPLMSMEQRKATAETVYNEVDNKAQVIVHVGTTNTKETIELAKHAEKIGVAAIGAVTPYYLKPSLEGLIKHYTLIAEAVSIPVLAYNIPSHAGFNLSPNIVAKLFKIQNIVGIKDSSEDLIQIREIIETAPKTITVINGADNLIFPALVMGVDAQISGIANVVPELVVKLYDAYKRGDYAKALTLQTKINAVQRVIETPPIAYIKAALELRGVKAGLPKKPILPLKKNEFLSLKEKLASLNLCW